MSARPRLWLIAAWLVIATCLIVGPSVWARAPERSPASAGATTVARSTTNQSENLNLAIASATVLLLLGQVLLAVQQIRISARQTNIMDRQTAIASRQADTAGQERQMNTRPNVTSEIIVDSGSGRRYWRVTNCGSFPVDNVRARYLRFVRYANVGWHARNQAFLAKADGLTSKEVWAVDLTGMRERFLLEVQDPPNTANSDFLVLLLFFERRIDGRPFLLIEPMYSIGNGCFTGMSLDSGGGVGPLDFHRNIAIELSFEFFKRHPLDRKYELYNFAYLLGYESRDDLGRLDWMEDVAGEWP